MRLFALFSVFAIACASQTPPDERSEALPPRVEPTSPSPAPTTTTPKTPAKPDPDEVWLDGYLTGAIGDANGPGASVLVVTAAKTLVRSFGRAGAAGASLPSAAAPVIDGSTLFRLSSNTKAFTALSVLILVSRSALHFEDTIASVLARTTPAAGEGTPITDVEGPSWAKTTTVEELLSMHSGAGRGECNGETISLDYQATPGFTDYDALRQLIARPVESFASKACRLYANANYATLSVLVERASGKPFESFVQTEVLQKLSMPKSLVYNSLYAPSQPALPQFPPATPRAFGYEPLSDATAYAQQEDDDATGVVGDGNLYTSAAEMAHWVEFWMAGDGAPLLSGSKAERAALLARATTTHDEMPVAGFGYGYGWRPVTFMGTTGVLHGGATTGFRSNVELYPSKHLAVVVLTNAGELAAPRSKTAEDMSDEIARHFW